MAAPAAVLAAKAALAGVSDKRGRTAIASVAAAVLTPFILILIVLMSAMSGMAAHNNAAVDLAFHGGYPSSNPSGIPDIRRNDAGEFHRAGCSCSRN